MSPGVKLLDAYDVYGRVVDELMVETGMADAPADEQRAMLARCMDADMVLSARDELMVWVLHGDDLRSMTRALVRGNLILGRGVRFGGF